MKFDGFPHVIASQQFSREFLDWFFQEVRNMEKIRRHKTGTGILCGRTMIALFYEPSTRTRFSFQMAMLNLGGNVLYTESAGQFSSAAKGEILLDTILVLNRYEPDVIVLRYDKEIGAEIAANISKVPIINAGDRQPPGAPVNPYSGQHPTQALLDIYTIQKRLGKIDGISVAMVGDLMNGRTVRSLAYLLAKFDNIKIYFVSPCCAQMKEDIKDYLKKHGVEFHELFDIRDVAPVVDVIYQTRTQKECGTSFERKKSGQGFFLIDETVTRAMKKNAIIMHPLPRVDEITPEVDSDPRAVYLTDQVDSGIHVRMALLKMIISPEA